MGAPRGWELLVLLLVVLLLFGAKRLPDTARGLGRSLRILKAETKGLRDDDDDRRDDVRTEPPAPAAQSAQSAPSARVTPEPRIIETRPPVSQHDADVRDVSER